MKRNLMFASLLFLTFSLGRAQESVKAPENWRKNDACGVTFYLPPDMTAPHKGQIGLDECAEIFQNDTMEISLETDPFPLLASKRSINQFNNLAQKPKFIRAKTKIGSRKAIIVSYYEPKAVDGFHYMSAMSIAAKGGFRIFAAMKDAGDQPIAEKIFRSVVFPRK
jgi:hypothetical protein